MTAMASEEREKVDRIAVVVGIVTLTVITGLWLHLRHEAAAMPQAAVVTGEPVESKAGVASRLPALPATPQKDLDAEAAAWKWVAQRHFVMKSPSIQGDLAHFEFEGAGSACVIEMKYSALDGGPSGWLVSKDDCMPRGRAATRK